MIEEYFAAVGVFAVVLVIVIIAAFVVIVVIDAVRNWLRSRSVLVKDVKRLCEVQTLLMKTNNDLNERVKALEEKHEAPELIDLAHNAWSIALCAMNGKPIPTEWGNAVERGLREHGIDVDEELAGFEVEE